MTAGSPTVTYAYAPDGTVYKRTVDGQATVYVGDLYERDTATGAVRTTYWVDGLPIAQQDAGGKTWLYTDRTGSVVATRRVNTAATDTVRYTPFGADRDATGQLATDRRFAGMRWEPALGLYRAGPRLYDPGVGQFLQPDPVTLADPFDTQLRNPYAYARGNPLRYADGSGMVPVPIGNGPRDVGGALLSAYDAQVQPSGQHACVPVAICNANAVLSDEAIAAVLQTYQARLGNGLVVRTDGIILAAAEGASEESEGGGGGGGGAPPPGDRGEAAGNAIKGLTGGRLARYLGMRGEAAIGLPRTKREAVRMPGFAPAIPDALDHRMKTITEVKNVSGKLGLSPQLKLFMEYARARGYTFELYVRAETRLTTTLRAAIESGDIVLRFLP